MQQQPSYRDSSDACRIYLLPNLFTAGNLFFGFLAILRFIQAKYGSFQVPDAGDDYYVQGMWCIVLAAVLDFFDGRLARSSGHTSLFGAEFDSLADLVSFGVAPALLVFFLILSPSPGNYPQYLDSLFLKFGWLVGFIYLLCCAGRLARFNVITLPLLPRSAKYAHVKDSIGLPVPAAAGVIVSLATILIHIHAPILLASLLLPLMVLVSLLMVSTIPFPVFKYLTGRLRTGLWTFIAFTVGAALILFFSTYSIALVFLGYLLASLVRYGHMRRRRRRELVCRNLTS
jgi:CDP-diacylglycerol--serine O-phosphatidyltransferase